MKKCRIILFDFNAIVGLKLDQPEFCAALLKGLEDSKRSNSGDLCHIAHGRIIDGMRKFLNLLYPSHHMPWGLFIDGVAIFKSSSCSIFPGECYSMM